MRYRKIHIIGGPGSGKTFSADKLSKMHNIPTYDLDDVFWDRATNDYRKRATETERNQALANILINEAWIIEGVYYRWLVQSFKDADLIVILIPSVWIRHKRIITRFAKRKLRTINSKKESLSDLWELIKWNHKFDKENIIRIRDFIHQHEEKTVVCKGLQDLLNCITV